MKLNTRQLIRIKWKNRLQTLVLLSLMCAFVWLLGRWLIGEMFAYYAVGTVILVTVFNPAFSPATLMKAYRATLIHPAQSVELHQLITMLAERAQLPAAPKLYYLPIGTMNAFACGTQRDSVIALSDGLLRNLTFHEMAGVLAHEISHIRHNDMLIMTISDLMGQITRILALVGQLIMLLAFPMLIMDAISLEVLPLVIIIMAPLFTALIQLALSRNREKLADIAATQLLGTPDPLINALIKLEQQSSYWERFYRASSDNALLRTHPTTNERIELLDSLNTQPRHWQPIHLTATWKNPWIQSPQISPRRVSRYFWF
jgi:heat shock protein HtpX